MKKVIFVMLTLVLSIGSMMAQQPQDRGPVNRGERMKMRIEQLKTNLNLNEDQVKKVEVLFLSQEEQMKELRKNAGENNEANREKMKQMGMERNSKMKEILTPEQFQKFGEMNKRNAQRQPEFRKMESAKGDSTLVKEGQKRVKGKKVKDVVPIQ